MASSAKSPPPPQGKRPAATAPKPRVLWSPNDKLGVMAATVLFFCVIYRLWLFDIANVVLRPGRVVQPIEDFPYDCRRVAHPLLEGCEDLWLDHTGRKLYAACSDLETRANWSPGAGVFNHSARTGLDHISVLDIDNPGADGLYGVRSIEWGTSAPANMALHGFDVREIDGRLRFFVVNHAAPLNATTGELLPVGNSVGFNSTIGIFDLSAVSGKLEHVKTLSSPAMIVLNDVTVSRDGLDVFFTNSHNHKIGLRRELEMFTGGGSVGHCRVDTGECRIVSAGLFNFPNGITRGRDDLYYVANSIKGVIFVFKYENGRFTDINMAYPQVPLDNLSVDADGDIIAITLPFVRQTVRSIQYPHEPLAPAGVLRIKKYLFEAEDGSQRPKYNMTTMIEDRDAKFLPTGTIAVHDTKTERLFVSGHSSKFITICQKRSQS